MRDLFTKIWIWSLGSRLRNWLSHAFLALLIALVVGAVVRFLSGPTIPAWMAGTFAAGGFYVLKEAEALMLRWAFGDPLELLDGVGDAVVPALALAALDLVRYGL